MMDNLAEIIREADNGDLDAMFLFVDDWEITEASLTESDIFERRFDYLNKLVEKEIPYAYGILAGYYYHGEYVEKDINKAINLYAEGAKYQNTDCCEELGLMYFLGRNVERDYKKAYYFFDKAIKDSKENDMNTSREKKVNSYYPFIAYLCMAEFYRLGILVEKDPKKASDYYANACFVIIDGYGLESDYQAIASYYYALERLIGAEDLYDCKVKTDFEKNIVEAFDILDELVSWDFEDVELLKGFNLTEEIFLKAHEKARIELLELYGTAKYVGVPARNYCVAKGEKDNEIFNFRDDNEAQDYLNDHCEYKGKDNECLKFVFNVETLESFFPDRER